MGFAVRVRSAGQKYGPTCHQRDRADVTEFVTLVRLSSLEQHVGVLALAGYKRRKSALTAGPIPHTDYMWSMQHNIHIHYTRIHNPRILHIHSLSSLFFLIIGDEGQQPQVEKIPSISLFWTWGRGEGGGGAVILPLRLISLLSNSGLTGCVCVVL